MSLSRTAQDEWGFDLAREPAGSEYRGRQERYSRLPTALEWRWLCAGMHPLPSQPLEKLAGAHSSQDTGAWQREAPADALPGHLHKPAHLRGLSCLTRQIGTNVLSPGTILGACSMEDTTTLTVIASSSKE